MSHQATIHRYTLIIEKIRKGYPSLHELQDFLEKHDFEVSTRTLQRDIEQIRFEFGLGIKYNTTRKGYYLDTDQNLDMDAFFRFLEMVTTAHLLTETLQEGKEALHYISFEAEGSLKGIENLKLLLFAIKKKRKVAFMHHSYTTGNKTGYQIAPYLLKEYQNRWYVLGMAESVNDIRTFGLDRMEQVEVLPDIFTLPKKQNIKDLFRHVVGLTYSLQEPEEIQLSFTALQGQYIKSLPLHHSQKIMLETKTELQVSIYVVPNYELIQKILMLGSQVKVLKPIKLAQDIKTILQQTLNQYS